MKVGDIVEVHIPIRIPGALTAAKFYTRLKQKTQDLPGIIIEDHGNSVSVLFGKELHIITKKHLRRVDNG